MVKNFNKVIKSLLYVYIIQFIILACSNDNMIDCNCPYSRKYELSYSDFNLKLLDTSGFTVSDISETVKKDELGIRLEMNFNFNEIAFEQKNGFSKLGFSSSYACTCVSDEFIYSNSINEIKIIATDTKTQDKIDVTSNFTAYVDRTEVDLKNLTNFIQDDLFWAQQNIFELDIKTSENIPDTAIFTIEVILSSNNSIIKQSEIINFE